jgi:hypothetical protein
MRSIRPTRGFLVVLLAVAFVLGSLNHGPAMMLAGPAMDCPHPMAGGAGDSDHAGHEQPVKILFGCPLANFGAYVAATPIAAGATPVRGWMVPPLASLLTSASLERADPPPR